MRHFNRGSLDYHFIDKIEAGIVLGGSDAKSLRTQTPQYANSRIEIINGQPTLFNFTIPLYKYSQGQTIDTTTERQLLLNRHQIAKLQSFRHQKYMLIPVSIYPKGKWFKVEIGIGRKLRKYERRQKIKDRELKQTIPKY